MFRAIIADDERKVRSIISRLGEWKEQCIEVVGEAEDGDALMEMIEVYNPDIVLTDMRMPGLCGAELIHDITTNYKKTKLIIISGYDDFEYMKQAIFSKVVDYILKPINRKDLNRALEKAINEINSERKKKEEQYILNLKLNKTMLLLKETKLNKIIYGEDFEEELPKYLNSFEEKIKAINYDVIIIKIINYFEVLDNVFKGDKELMFMASTNIIDEICDKKGVSFKNNRIDNEIVIILNMKSSRENVNKLLNKIGMKLFEFLKIKICCGIGNTVTDVHLIQSCTEQARIALKQINLNTEQTRLFYNEITKKENTLNKLNYNIALLQAAVKNANINFVKKYYKKVLDEMVVQECLSIEELDDFKKDTNVLFENFSVHENKKQEFLEELASLRDALNNEYDLENLKDKILEFLNKLEELVEYIGNNDKKLFVYDIRHFIEENYTSKITLDDLSERYFFSKEYISRSFKEAFGVKMSDYIIDLKINKAKEYLLEDEMSISQISEYLGFVDESHFSRTFKKKVEQTPIKYRKMQGKNE